MKFSTFQIMHLLEGESSQQVVNETIDAVCRSEELNFANVWLAEHHSPYCINGAPGIIGSAIAMKTSRLGIGYAVNIMPFSHPLRLAEELSLVDQLSKGRLIAGLGSGNQEREFDMYGLNYGERREMAKESLEIIRRLWAGETVTFEGDHYSLKDAKLAALPFQKPHPPICMAVASVEAAAAMGELGFHINVAGPFDDRKAAIQAYRDACRPGFDGHVGYLRNVYVGDGEIDVERVKRANAVFTQLLTGNPDVEQKTIDLFYDCMGVYGTCEEMIDELKVLEDFGVDEILCSFKWGDLSYDEAMTSMEVFADRVVPAFN